MKRIFQLLLCVSIGISLFSGTRYWWIWLIVAGVCFYAIMLCNGGFSFWKACAKDPIKAYEYMLSHPDVWKIYTYRETVVPGEIDKKAGWSGPYSLVVPGIGTIKIFSKEPECQAFESEFVKLVSGRS